MDPIYLSSPDVGALEEDYVVRAIRSGWAAPLGPEVDAFEDEVRARVGREHAVALSSGTAALHLALLAWGVRPGDVVPTASMTFAATANAVRYTGAIPYFIDCDPTTGNIDVALLDDVLGELASAGRDVPAVVTVDLLGRCADYAGIAEVCEHHGVRVLSDCAESFGAHAGSVPAGAFGDAAVFSFNGNKIMTTSGGGMLLTDDALLASRARFLATQAREPAVHYEHRQVGYNYRLSNLLAALGRAQLTRLDEMIGRRRVLRETYRAIFSGAAGTTIFQGEGDARDNCWLTAILVDPAAAGWDTAELATWLRRAGIETRPLWKPMHLQPAFSDHPARVTGASERLFATGLCLPSGSVLMPAAIDRIATAITEFLALSVTAPPSDRTLMG